MTENARGHGWRYAPVLLVIALAALMLVSTAAAGEAKFTGGNSSPPGLLPLANFSIGSPVTGVAPYTVQFFDNSTVEGLTSRSWDFGDSSTSTEENPKHTYTTAGTYTISLRVQNATGWTQNFTGEHPLLLKPDGSAWVENTGYTLPGPIIVIDNPGPTVDFTWIPSTNTPVNFPVTFTATNSAGGPVADSGYYWNFGDGTTATGKVVTHRFTGGARTQKVTLTATNTLGQESTPIAKDVSLVAQTPAVIDSITTNLTANTGTLSKDGKLPVLFNAVRSVGDGSRPETFTWEFGDGTQGTSTYPDDFIEHVYTKAGTYLANVTGTNAAGTSVKQQVTVIVNLPGSATAQFHGSSPDGTKDVLSHAAIPTAVDLSYLAPATFDFRIWDADADEATTWTWDFGDGSALVTARNVTHTYSTPGPYTVKMSAKNVGGEGQAYMKVEALKPITPTAKIAINKTPADPTIDPFTGATLHAGRPISFGNMSDGNPTSFKWVFSDAPTTVYSTDADTTKTFPVGNYWVEFTATTAAGSSQFFTHFTIVPAPANEPLPVVDFFVDLKSPVALNQTTTADAQIFTVTVRSPVNFTNNSVNKPTSFRWTLDGSAPLSTAPTWTYTPTTTGTKIVRLYASNANGESSRWINLVVVEPTSAPVADFTYTPNAGDVPTTVKFTDTSTWYPNEWFWNFGDGYTSTAQNPSHTYTSPGTYAVTLKATNERGFDFSEQKLVQIDPITKPYSKFTAYVEKPGPQTANSWTPGSYVTGQHPLTVTFTDKSDFYPKQWKWAIYRNQTASPPVLEYTSTLKTFDYTFTQRGAYSVQLIVTNEAGDEAEYTAWNMVYVDPSKPIADFTWASPVVAGAPAQFTDLSTFGPQVWAWGWGDNTPGAVGQNPTHTFATPGTYAVTLQVWNDWGTSVISKVVTVVALGPSVADFTWTPANPTAGDPVTFTDQSTNDPSAWWWIINGESKDTKDVTYTFATPGTYTVTLLAKNAAMTGWSNPVTKLITVAGEPTTTVTTEVTTEVTTPVTTAIGGNQPYPAAHNLPARVEAEDYDVSAGYPAYSDTTAANEGGAYRTDSVDIEVGGSNFNVGWIRAGEFLTYSVDSAAAGTYNIQFRVANPGAAKTVTVSVNGAAKSLTIPATGGFTKWQTVTLTGVSLDAGRNIVKVDMGNAASFNFDYMEFVSGGSTQPTTVVTTTTTTQAPSGGATFMAAPNPVKKSNLIRFTLTPASGKTIKSAWWTFDKVGHYNTWNSRNINPGFYYPATGTFTPLVKITYTDGTTEEVYKTNYVTVTK